MDLNILFRLRPKKNWWLDVIFYFVISLLVATILCYGIFWLKNGMQKKEIKAEEAKLLEVGTTEQKGFEKDVIYYQKKINNFNSIFNGHEFASNVFALFIEKATMPNVWFKNFNFDEKAGQIQLSGEAESMDDLSRQTAVFERDKYVKSLDLFNSSSGSSEKISFNITITLNQEIFNYIEENPIVASEPVPNQENQPVNSTENTLPAKSSLKLITLFNLPLKPEVSGSINPTNYTIALDVPFGTKITGLKPRVNISTGAQVFPLSDAVQDFSKPVDYKVTAEDGTTQDYTVTVNVLPKPKSSNSALIIGIVVVLIVVIAVIIVVIIFIRKKLKKPAPAQ